MVIGLNINAQNSIKGKVTDEFGDALIGVSVISPDKQKGTITDYDGNYSINLSKKDSIIIFSYLGYETVITAIRGRNHINVSMTPVSIELDEVVTIGYGQMKKSDLTGSLSSVTEKDLERSNMSSLEQGLSGKVAGVYVIETDGAPGGAISMQIRGSNSMLGGTEPLYVIDGVPVSSNNAMFSTRNIAGGQGGTETSPPNILSTINPNDIVSIEILKDASATAIYGSRGANGVVLISTRQGIDGKTNVSFKMSTGISKLSKRIEVLDYRTYADYVNEAVTNAGFAQKFFEPDSITKPETQLPFPTSGTDWQNEIFQSGFTNDINLNISGGTKSTRYSVSLSRTDEEGILKSSGFNRTSIRANLNSQLSEFVKLTSNNMMSYSENRIVSANTSSSGQGAGVVKQALRISPLISINSAGIDSEDTSLGDDEPRNPYRELVDPLNNKISSRVLSSQIFDFFLTKDLTLKVSNSVNYINTRTDRYYPRTTFRGIQENGKGQIATLESMNLINEDMLTWSKKYGIHDINLMGVFSFENTVIKNTSYQVSNFPTDALKTNAMQYGDQTTALLYSDNITNTLASGTLRANYNYAQKYYMTFSMRADGSSKFAKNNEMGYFPSFALTWRASEESFIKNIKNISLAKLRYSYGRTGNQAISEYQSLASLDIFKYVVDGAVVPGFADIRFPNDKLKWETTDQHNVGLDFGFFNNRLTITANLYHKMTWDLLQNIVLPGSSGWSSQIKNAGIISNQGFELELTGHPIKGTFNWETTFNYSLNRNKILDLGGVDQRFSARLGAGQSMNFAPSIQKVGYPLGTLWGYIVDGVYQNVEDIANSPDQSPLGEPMQVGFIKYKNLNPDEDNIVNAKDMTVIGDVNPDFMIGFNNVFSYKGFDLQVLLHGVFGQDIFNQTRIELMQMDGSSNITREVWDNRFRGEGTGNGRYPSVYSASKRKMVASDLFVEDGSYLRVKNIRLSYTFKFKNKAPIRTLNVFGSADNLWTFTNYSGYDPEVGSYGQDPSRRGIDVGSYPKSRNFIFGFNANF
ncbi:TonB-dependent receptor [Paludibacter sp.]